MSDSELIALAGIPRVSVTIENVRLQPKGDGALKVMIFDEPEHGLCWHAIEEHALEKEVIVLIGGRRFSYIAQMGHDEMVYLFPFDGQNTEVPHNDVFMRRKAHLILKYA